MVQIKEDAVGKTKTEHLSNTIDEQNDVKASESEALGTSNPALRNRHKQQSKPPTRSTINDAHNQTHRNRRSILTSWSLKNPLMILIIIIITLLAFHRFRHIQKEGINKVNEDKEQTDSIFENLAEMADSTSKELAELDIPGTSVTNKYRATFLNLGVILNKSDVIVQNGVQIARDLFKLSDDFKDAGYELSEFMDQADDFFYSLSSELNAIKDILNQQEGFFAYYLHRDDGKMIRDKLKTLEKNVPGFHAQLKRVIDALQIIEKRSAHTQEYLITGEKEAQKVIKDHWLGKITDYEERKRAEEERRQVLHVLELLKNMLPNLLDFQSFLDRYRKQLSDLHSKIELNRAILKPSKDTLKYLIRAAEKLETSHKNFIRKENQLGQRPTNTLYLEDERNTIHRDCTEFDIKFSKPNNVYLKKLRIWSTHFINAIAFFYSNGSYEMFGTPGPSEPFDFEWHKGEKIRRFDLSFASIVYGLEITTTRGRSTEWVGGKNGHQFYTEMPGRVFDGLFGSFSKYICSIEVSHGQ